MRRPYAILFRERAARQLAEAQEWLLANRGAKRVRELADELGTAFHLLEACPEMYALVPGSKSVRRLRLARNGYHLYYRVFHREERIVVTRVRHERQRPPVER